MTTWALIVHRARARIGLCKQGAAFGDGPWRRKSPDEQQAALMQQLPEKLRTAVYYADIEGRRFKEIAEITDGPIGTVMSRLHRGRLRLARGRGRLITGAGRRARKSCSRICPYPKRFGDWPPTACRCRRPADPSSDTETVVIAR
jgi:Sigma-70, region 4